MPYIEKPAARGIRYGCGIATGVRQADCVVISVSEGNEFAARVELMNAAVFECQRVGIVAVLNNLAVEIEWLFRCVWRAG